jgi:hypothetical protein
MIKTTQPRGTKISPIKDMKRNNKETYESHARSEKSEGSANIGKEGAFI